MMTLPVRQIIGDDTIPATCWVIVAGSAVAHKVPPWPLTEDTLRQLDQVRTEGNLSPWNTTLFFPPGVTYAQVEGYLRENVVTRELIYRLGT